MASSWQVILAGEGGQGLVVAGVVLGEAAMLEGLNAAHTAAYGIASRGGFTKSEIVIDDQDISYPGVEEPNVVIALTQGAFDRYDQVVPETCQLIFDADFAEGEGGTGKRIKLPICRTRHQAMEDMKEMGDREDSIPLNLMCLGILAGTTGIVQLESLEKAVEKKFQKGFEKNQQALRLGFELTKSI